MLYVFTGEKSEGDRGQEIVQEHTACLRKREWGRRESVNLSHLSLLSAFPFTYKYTRRSSLCWAVSTSTFPLLSRSNSRGASSCPKSSERFSSSLWRSCFVPLCIWLPWHYPDLLLTTGPWTFLLNSAPLFLLACPHSIAFCSCSQVFSLYLSLGSCVSRSWSTANQVWCLPNKIYMLVVTSELQSEYPTACWTTPPGSNAEISNQRVQSESREKDRQCFPFIFESPASGIQ